VLAIIALRQTQSGRTASGFVAQSLIGIWIFLPTFTFLGWKYGNDTPSGLKFLYSPELVFKDESPPSSPLQFNNLPLGDGEIHEKVIFADQVPFIGESGSAIWHGQIIISNPGIYEFATISDDGSALFIDNALVVSNWGIHTMDKKIGAILLEPGKHKLDINYYNRGLESGMILLWAAPGEPFHPIPPRRLIPGD